MYKVRFAAIEHEVNRIDRHDGGQRRCATLSAGDQISGVDAPVRDAAGNRRAHLGPFKIELGLLQRRVCRHNRGRSVLLR